MVIVEDYDDDDGGVRGGYGRYGNDVGFFLVYMK